MRDAIGRGFRHGLLGGARRETNLKSRMRRGAPPPAAALRAVLEFAFLSRENRLQAINDGSSPVAAAGPHPAPLPVERRAPSSVRASRGHSFSRGREKEPTPSAARACREPQDRARSGAAAGWRGARRRCDQSGRDSPPSPRAHGLAGNSAARKANCNIDAIDPGLVTPRPGQPLLRGARRFAFAAR